MGNCVAMKQAIGNEDQTVVLVRDRKRLIKAAIKHRQALAEAHGRYNHSLYTVAAAIDLFVALHSYHSSGEGEADVGNGNGTELVPRAEGTVELFDALRGIEDQFIKAYEAGKAISEMLEKTNVNPCLGIEGIKENSMKLIQDSAWRRPPSSLSSSTFKINLASSFKDIALTECNSELPDKNDGMASGSHSQTLVKLYAWEKKLLAEVKTGDYTRREYDKKLLELKKEDGKGANSRPVDNARVKVRELYTRICVTLRYIETVSKSIEKIRDEELQPQLIELLQGLSETWKIMLESHETQKKIISEVTSFICPSYGTFNHHSQRDVTQKLEEELQNWRKCFKTYIAEQRAYVEVLNGWLSKFIIPDMEYFSRKTSIPSIRTGEHLLVTMTRDWNMCSKQLPDNAVTFAMKVFIKEIRALLDKQGDEHQQKRKVDAVAREHDRKVTAMQKAETKLLELNPSADEQQREDYIAWRRNEIESLKKKLEAEKGKHEECMKETQSATLKGFKKNLSNIFESLTDFSKDSLKMYDDLLTQNEVQEVTA